MAAPWRETYWRALRFAAHTTGRVLLVKSKICEMLNVEFPLVAFSHCRDVVAAVSRAGGFGVLGATAFSPEQLEIELTWIEAHADNKPYGLDVLIPENLPLRSEKGLTREGLVQRIPEAHRVFVNDLLVSHGVEVPSGVFTDRADGPPPFALELAMGLLEVAFRHPIRLIANALGVPPPEMVAMAREHGVPLAALAGAKEHALRLADAGVDIVVAQGSEAGGHCGEVSTLVLVPEVVRALKAAGRDIPVLAAGGIMTGRQMAGCMAMGAAGAWTGSVWLATPESETSEVFREKLVSSGSRDTIRSKSRTGKYSRQLRSGWTDAWEGEHSPGALPMPMQSLISEPALRSIEMSAAAGNPEARKLVTYFVGQGVGLLDGVKSSRAVVAEFMDEFAEAAAEMSGWLYDDASEGGGVG
jgi:NAD(P)H-dependent flavin oxidoreductase YrpB (nitropropane dioxygenase family)